MSALFHPLYVSLQMAQDVVIRNFEIIGKPATVELNNSFKLDLCNYTDGFN